VRLLELAHVDGDDVLLAAVEGLGQASAVSVLPTPEGPASRNTPMGLFGLSARRGRSGCAWRSSPWQGAGRGPFLRSNGFPGRLRAPSPSQGRPPVRPAVHRVHAPWRFPCGQWKSPYRKVLYTPAGILEIGRDGVLPDGDARAGGVERLTALSGSWRAGM
jgi:hypothetical protein